jgi:hypothetical protein
MFLMSCGLNRGVEFATEGLLVAEESEVAGDDRLLAVVSTSPRLERMIRFRIAPASRSNSSTRSRSAWRARLGSIASRSRAAWYLR